jgi:hypothetical protein
MKQEERHAGVDSSFFDVRWEEGEQARALFMIKISLWTSSEYNIFQT